MMSSDEMDEWTQRFFNDRSKALKQNELDKKPLTKEELAKLIGTDPLNAYLSTVWLTLHEHGYKIVKK